MREVEEVKIGSLVLNRSLQSAVVADDKGRVSLRWGIICRTRHWKGLKDKMLHQERTSNLKICIARMRKVSHLWGSVAKVALMQGPKSFF